MHFEVPLTEVTKRCAFDKVVSACQAVVEVFQKLLGECWSRVVGAQVGKGMQYDVLEVPLIRKPFYVLESVLEGALPGVRVFILGFSVQEYNDTIAEFIIDVLFGDVVEGFTKALPVKSLGLETEQSHRTT